MLKRRTLLGAGFGLAAISGLLATPASAAAGHDHGYAARGALSARITRAFCGTISQR